MTRVTFERLAKKYGRATVLQPFDLDVTSEIVVILGANGSGKSTLLQRASEVVRGGGTPRYGGRRIGELPWPRRVVGTSFGPASLDSGLSPLRLLAAHAAISNVPHARVDLLLEELGLASDRSRRISSLSQGTRQRVSLALALLGEPEVLLLDEPEAGLDAVWRSWLSERLDRQRTHGGSVLLSVHDVGFLSSEPDRVLHLAGGRVSAKVSAGAPDPGTHQFVFESTGQARKAAEALSADRLVVVAQDGRSIEIEGPSLDRILEVVLRGKFGVTEIRTRSWRDMIQG